MMPRRAMRQAQEADRPVAGNPVWRLWGPFEAIKPTELEIEDEDEDEVQLVGSEGAAAATASGVLSGPNWQAKAAPRSGTLRP